MPHFPACNIENGFDPKQAKGSGLLFWELCVAIHQFEPILIRISDSDSHWIELALPVSPRLMALHHCFVTGPRCFVTASSHHYSTRLDSCDVAARSSLLVWHSTCTATTSAPPSSSRSTSEAHTYACTSSHVHASNALAETCASCVCGTGQRRVPAATRQPSTRRPSCNTSSSGAPLIGHAYCGRHGVQV